MKNICWWWSLYAWINVNYIYETSGRLREERLEQSDIDKFGIYDWIFFRQIANSIDDYKNNLVCGYFKKAYISL